MRRSTSVIILTSVIALNMTASASTTDELKEYYNMPKTADEYLVISSLVDEYNTSTLDKVSIKDIVTEDEYGTLATYYESSLALIDAEINISGIALQQAERLLRSQSSANLGDLLKLENKYRQLRANRQSLIEDRRTNYLMFQNNPYVKEILEDLFREIPIGDSSLEELGDSIAPSPIGYDYLVSKPYGVFINMETKELEFNKGIYLHAPRGSQVKALYNGVVELKTEKVILINHGGSVVSTYTNVGSIDVDKSQVVSQGDTIGTSLGEDIHVGLFINGQPQNVEQIISSKE